MASTLIDKQLQHQPVLYQEIIHALQPGRGGYFIDGTVGAGGHAWGILDASAPDSLLLGLDVDPQALDLARERLAIFGNRAILVRASYTSLPVQMAKLGWKSVAGVVLDLGLSSMQLNTAERGFSFLTDAPLDMRFDPEGLITAADLVNTLSEQGLADILYKYGEERGSRRIARAIINARPVMTTRQLAQIVSRSAGGQDRRSHINRATRTFQALRIAVNRELESLEAVLPLAVNALAPGGRLAVIAFHSLEDRLVKQYFRLESQDCICPPPQPVCTCGHKASLRELTRKPIRPQPEEVQSNPRSRSARLRTVEKL